eukprot:TRINITY_DN64780_c0_g1_i1.p1 TRINITY_DN64780_c0_g1~~TRINITY_DN64780_c0_g1_i1.p1  ORF type:complete len:223 (-),score=34.42 TRINITY_DN64780_c0_g1_i1:170-838(-)
MLAGDPAKQFEWHENYRDMMKNMYRTTYTDMAHGRETYCKSDFPSGYGGHIPCIRHDVLFKNTSFERNRVLNRSDPSRDAFPSFVDQISGLPTVTKHPCGAKKNPTKGVVPHDGTTTMLRPPWGIMSSKRDPLNYRATPATMMRSHSSPLLTAGSHVASPTHQNHRSEEGGQLQSFLESTASFPSANSSPKGERLRRTVDFANELANSRMPDESGMLRAELP